MRSFAHGTAGAIRLFWWVCLLTAICPFVLATDDPPNDTCKTVANETVTPCDVDLMCECSGSMTRTYTYSKEGGCEGLFRVCRKRGTVERVISVSADCSGNVSSADCDPNACTLSNPTMTFGDTPDYACPD
jgi:hypothetical protein